MNRGVVKRLIDATNNDTIEWTGTGTTVNQSKIGGSVYIARTAPSWFVFTPFNLGGKGTVFKSWKLGRAVDKQRRRKDERYNSLAVDSLHMALDEARL